jgi:mannose-6-phosphate isomerase-like protein (cupin superfamily)
MARIAQLLVQSETVSAADFGALSQWREFVRQHPVRGQVPGKTFLGEVLGLSGMEVSLGSMLPGEAMPFRHAHKQNEELYLVLSGEGEMLVDDAVIPLRGGTAVRIAPAASRCWRALGAEPMAYVVIQAKAGSLEQATGKDGIVLEGAPQWASV